MWNNFRKGWMGWLLHKTLSSKKSPCWYFLYFKQSTWHTKEWFDIGMIDWHVDRILLMIQKPGQPDDMENSLKYHIYLWNSNITGGARLLPSTVFTNMAKITSQIASNHENTLVKSHVSQCLVAGIPIGGLGPILSNPCEKGIVTYLKIFL